MGQRTTRLTGCLLGDLLICYAKPLFNVFLTRSFYNLAREQTNSAICTHQNTLSHNLFLKKNFEAKIGDISEYVENIPLAQILLKPFCFCVLMEHKI